MPNASIFRRDAHYDEGMSKASLLSFVACLFLPATLQAQQVCPPGQDCLVYDPSPVEARTRRLQLFGRVGLFGSTSMVLHDINKTGPVLEEMQIDLAPIWTGGLGYSTTFLEYFSMGGRISVGTFSPAQADSEHASLFAIEAFATPRAQLPFGSGESPGEHAGSVYLQTPIGLTVFVPLQTDSLPEPAFGFGVEVGTEYWLLDPIGVFVEAGYRCRSFDYKAAVDKVVAYELGDWGLTVGTTLMF